MEVFVLVFMEMVLVFTLTIASNDSCEYACGYGDDEGTMVMVAIQSAMMCLLLLLVK